MYVPIELDKTRNFRYGMKAISYIEKKFKQPIAKVDLNGLTMEEAAVVICAGLMHEDKKLTPDKVMDLIDEKGNFMEVIKAMGKAFNEAFGGNEVEIIEEKNE
ncbi:hypothetical protein [Clostridium celatum]|uniref:hypothetical protein n=1 Tax=Clostridium celatum TaxID=36834 RepID=UPI00291197D7|nr:hypothetical protein [Clostridium celatum]MDU6296814.1 hypothetical protein [Clostridium celatum]